MKEMLDAEVALVQASIKRMWSLPAEVARNHWLDALRFEPAAEGVRVVRPVRDAVAR